MEDQWDDAAAEHHDGALGQCVYCTRLIGSDPALVLHGGGNSSVKTPWTDITGRTSRRDPTSRGRVGTWRTIEAAGFTPLRVERLHELLELDRLSDTGHDARAEMARLDPSAPEPVGGSRCCTRCCPIRRCSTATPTSIVTLTNLADGDERRAVGVRRRRGDRALRDARLRPGPRRAGALAGRPHPGTVGMVLLNHGLFTFGDDSRQAYRRHVELIDRAEQWLDREAPPASDAQAPAAPDPCRRWRRSSWPSCAGRSRAAAACR